MKIIKIQKALQRCMMTHIFFHIQILGLGYPTAQRLKSLHETDVSFVKFSVGNKHPIKYLLLFVLLNFQIQLPSNGTYLKAVDFHFSIL